MTAAAMGCRCRRADIGTAADPPFRLPTPLRHQVSRGSQPSSMPPTTLPAAANPYSCLAVLSQLFLNASVTEVAQALVYTGLIENPRSRRRRGQQRSGCLIGVLTDNLLPPTSPPGAATRVINALTGRHMKIFKTRFAQASHALVAARAVLALCAAFTAISLAGCALLSPATPAPTRQLEPMTEPAPTATHQGRCGDGDCDENEKENPSLCPEDCGDEAVAETPRPTPADQSEHRCGDDVCDGPENPDTCPEDCAGEPTPLPTETPGSTNTRPLATAVPTPSPVPDADTELVSLSGGALAVRGDRSALQQQGGGTSAAKQINVAFILDGSGSMNAQLDGGSETKLAVAKDVLSDLIQQVPEEMHGALWIYGHRHPQEPKAESCRDIEQVFTLGPISAPAYVEAIQSIDALGYTPIADSLRQAAETLPAGDDQSNTIVLVSDGKETCGGDPCALAAALKESGASITIHVVGYAVDEETRAELQCIADASGGTYSDASSAQRLKEALEAALELAESDTTLRVEVAGPEDREVDARVLLYEPGAETLVAGFNAWRDNVVAPGTYDVWIETVPPVLYPELDLPEGSQTIVRLGVGSFDFSGLDGQSVDPYQVNVNHPPEGEQLGYLLDPGEEPYYVLGGTYMLALYPSISSNAPQAVFHTAIAAGQHTELQLGALDLLGVDGEKLRPSTVEFRRPGSQEAVTRFTQAEPYFYYVAPGAYDVWYTMSWTCGSWSGWLEDVVIEPSQITVTSLGSYVLRDPAGERLAYAHTLYDWDTGQEAGYYCGQVDTYYAAPGTYDIEGRYVDFVVDDVVIEAGQQAALSISE